MWLGRFASRFFCCCQAALRTAQHACLVFLTRDACEHPDMMNNLDDALLALGWRRDYQVINIGKLPADDVRTGYPTPTLLWTRKDIFGMPAPKPPYNVPS